MHQVRKALNVLWTLLLCYITCRDVLAWVYVYLLSNYRGEHRYRHIICAADCADAVQGHPIESAHATSH